MCWVISAHDGDGETTTKCGQRPKFLDCLAEAKLMPRDQTVRLANAVTYDPPDGPDWALIPEGTGVEVLNHVRSWAIQIRADTDDVEHAEGAVPSMDTITLEVTADDLEDFP